MKKRRGAIRARLGVADHRSTTPDGVIPFSAFPNSTTSELAACFALSIMLNVNQKAVNTNFQVIGLTGPGIEMLNVNQKSCEYQFSSHWFDRTRN